MNAFPPRSTSLHRRCRALLPAMLAALASASVAATESRELTIDGPDGPLAGTLLLPDERTGGDDGPAVLILPGSGPTDRDGNSPPFGVVAATYRLLAEGLAERGVPSLRADKRGLFGSAAAVASADDVLVSDYVRDTRAWRDALARESTSDCVVLLGHSEGGLVALATAAGALADENGAATDPGGPLCGLILLATPGRPLGDVLREQLAANPANAPLLEEANAAIDALERGERVDGATLSPALAPLFRPPVQGFLIELLALDPAALLDGLELPVLVVQGERDIQVSVADAERLAEAAPTATLVRLEDANHVLKAVPADDRAANVAAYRDPDRPLADGLVDAIADFVGGLGD